MNSLNNNNLSEMNTISTSWIYFYRGDNHGARYHRGS